MRTIVFRIFIFIVSFFAGRQIALAYVNFRLKSVRHTTPEIERQKMLREIIRRADEQARREVEEAQNHAMRIANNQPEN